MEKSRGIRAVKTREGSPHDSDLADSEAPAKLPVAHRRQPLQSGGRYVLLSSS